MRINFVFYVLTTLVRSCVFLRCDQHALEGARGDQSLHRIDIVIISDSVHSQFLLAILEALQNELQGDFLVVDASALRHLLLLVLL